MSEVADWLGALGMSEYAQRFAENGIDVSILRYLTDQALRRSASYLGIDERYSRPSTSLLTQRGQSRNLSRSLSRSHKTLPSDGN